MNKENCALKLVDEIILYTRELSSKLIFIVSLAECHNITPLATITDVSV